MNTNQNDTGVDGSTVSDAEVEKELAELEQILQGNESGAAVSESDNDGLDQAPVADTDGDDAPEAPVSDDEDPCADADEGAGCGA
jgi:hypothetical protein